MPKEKINLYEHNQRSYDKIVNAIGSGKTNVLLVQGTGTGKSMVALKLADEYLAGKRILYIVPKTAISIYLSTQKEMSLVQDRLDFTTYADFGFEGERKVQEYCESYDAFFIDESHHVGSVLQGTVIRQLMETAKKSPGKVVIGLTATPEREDGVDVRSFYDDIVEGFSTVDAIHAGFMPSVEYVVCSPEEMTEEEKRKCRQVLDFTMDESEMLLDQVVLEYPRDRWLAFFSSIEAMHETEGLINSLFPEHRIIKVSSDTEGSQKAISEITDGEKVVIMSVDMLLEGLHLPAMQGVLLFRNVTSNIVFSQIFGRITRIGEKENPVFVDCTQAGYKYFERLLTEEEEDGSNNNASYPQGESRPVVVASLKTKQRIDFLKCLDMIRSRDTAVIVHGVLYESRKDLCDRMGFRYNGFSKFMLKHGYDIEEAVDAYKALHERFEFRNKTYPSSSVACAEYGLSMNNVYATVKHYNITYQEAMEMYLDGRIGTTRFVFRDNEYASFAAACREYGLSNANVSGTAKYYGITKQEALEMHLSGKIQKKGGEFAFRDHKYASCKDACEDYNLASEHVCDTARRLGITKQEVMELCLNGKMQKKEIRKKRDPFTFRNQDYSSFAAACREYGLSRDRVLAMAKRRGITREETMELYLDGTIGGNCFSFRGKKYSSFAAACREYGLCIDQVRSTASYYGLTKQKAMEMYLNGEITPKEKGFVFRGKTYDYCAAACEEYGVNPVNIYRMASKLGITHQEVMEMYLNGGITTTKREFVFRGKQYRSCAAACKEYGLEPIKVYQKAEKIGITHQEVLEMYLNGKMTIKEKNFVFRGKEYLSCAAACKEYGLDPAKVYRRASKLGIANQEAMEILLS